MAATVEAGREVSAVVMPRETTLRVEYVDPGMIERGAGGELKAGARPIGGGGAVCGPNDGAGEDCGALEVGDIVKSCCVCCSGSEGTGGCGGGWTLLVDGAALRSTGVSVSRETGAGSMAASSPCASARPRLEPALALAGGGKLRAAQIGRAHV